MAGQIPTPAPVKPGIKTTEFWTMVGSVGALVSGILPVTLPPWVLAAISAAYMISRGLAKQQPTQQQPTQ